MPCICHCILQLGSGRVGLLQPLYCNWAVVYASDLLVAVVCHVFLDSAGAYAQLQYRLVLGQVPAFVLQVEEKRQRENDDEQRHVGSSGVLLVFDETPTPSGTHPQLADLLCEDGFEGVIAAIPLKCGGVLLIALIPIQTFCKRIIIAVYGWVVIH